MKKMFLLLAFFGALSLGAAQAQSCCASKASAGKTASCSTSTAACEKAAAGDASIEKRVNEHSGEVSYVRKVSNNGQTSFVPVDYDAATGKFVNVAPSTSGAAPKAACCSGGAKTGASCSQKAPAVKTATTSVKTASPSSTGGQK